jgi:hypothetical protein
MSGVASLQSVTSLTGGVYGYMIFVANEEGHGRSIA